MKLRELRTRLAVEKPRLKGALASPTARQTIGFRLKSRMVRLRDLKASNPRNCRQVAEIEKVIQEQGWKGGWLEFDVEDSEHISGTSISFAIADRNDVWPIASRLIETAVENPAIEVCIPTKRDYRAYDQLILQNRNNSGQWLEVIALYRY